MRSNVWNAVWAIAIYIAGIFMLPYFIVTVVNHPHDYWNWVGLVIWAYLLLSTLVEAYIKNPIVSAIKEEN